MSSLQDPRPEAPRPRKVRKKKRVEFQPDQQSFGLLKAGPSSSVENYNRYYQEPEASHKKADSFTARAQQHYKQYLETQANPGSQNQVNALFEPQFILDSNFQAPRTSRGPQLPRLALPDNQSSQSSGGNNQPVKLSLDWIAKPTKEGFLYFQIHGTNTYQWNFPQFFNPKTKQNQYLFVTNWVKCLDATQGGSKKYWRHRDYPSYTQTVKPHKETHLIEAAIDGNLAFLEVYVKFKGDLTMQDQQGKSALMHAILHNRKSFVKMICQFSTLFQEQPQTFVNLLELADRHGSTPLFTAIRVNSAKILQLLISYKVNFFHRKKNGNTCLHECAQYNAVDCLLAISSYCGHELFSIINKEGDRAIDISHRKQHDDVFQLLQRLERNLMYQDAVLERDQYKKAKVHPGKPSRPDPRLIEDTEEERLHPSRLIGRPQRRRDSSSNADSSFERKLHLSKRQITENTSSNYFADKKMRKYLKSQSKQRDPNPQPTFKNYRESIVRDSKIQKDVPVRKQKVEASVHQSQGSREYFSQLRRQRDHQANYFGEESYFRGQDLPAQQNDSYHFYQDEAGMIQHQIDKSIYKNSNITRDKSYFDEPRLDGSKIDLDQPENQLFNSRLLLQNNQTVDDIEKQRFRVAPPQQRREATPEDDSFRDRGYSLVEKALKDTQTTIVNIVSFIYQGFGALRSQVAGETRRTGPRSRSVSFPAGQTQTSQYFRNSQLEAEPRMGRFSQAGTSRYASTTRQARAPEPYPEQESSQGGQVDEFYTAYGRSQSRAPRPGSRVSHFQRGSPCFREPEVETQSIGIQADGPGAEEVSELKGSARKNSVGVGSICINQSNAQQTATPNDQTIGSQSRRGVNQLARSRVSFNDLSHRSIATQKFTNDSEIKVHKGRKAGKRAGRKAQLLMKESKNFQSSEDEKLALASRLGNLASTDQKPRPLREQSPVMAINQELQKQNLMEHQAQVERQKRIEEQPVNQLVTAEQKSLRSSSHLGELQGGPHVHQSTTQHSTSNAEDQKNSNAKYRLDAAPEEEKEHIFEPKRDDIADFYTKLMLNNLSLTHINELEGENSNTEEQIKQLSESIAIILLADKSRLLKANKAQADDSVAFNANECQTSLVTMDLEMGQTPIQQEENYAFFTVDDDESLVQVIEGSLLEPFAECLSECTFILQERGSYLGSRCASNLFDKGYIENSRQNQSCFSNAGGKQNLSLNLHTLAHHNAKVNLSGFEARPSGIVIHPCDEDLVKLKLVVDDNIKATLPRPKQGKRQLRSRSSMAHVPRVSALELSLASESAQRLESPTKDEKTGDNSIAKELDSEVLEKEIIQVHRPVIKPIFKEENEAEEQKPEEQLREDLDSSLPPGALTPESRTEKSTPLLREGDHPSSGENANPVDDPSDSNVQLAINIQPASPDPPARSDKRIPILEKEAPKPLFMSSFSSLTGRINDSKAATLPSTRYDEQEECSVLEQKQLEEEDQHEEAKQRASDVRGEQGRLRRPKATRQSVQKEQLFTLISSQRAEPQKRVQQENDQPEVTRQSSRRNSSKRSGKTPARQSAHRESSGLLSSVERLLGSSSNRGPSRADSSNRGRSRGPREVPDKEEDLTKVDFDLTQLNQTCTPRILNQVARHEAEQKEVAEREPEPSQDREVSLSFETSTILKDQAQKSTLEEEQKEERPQSEAREEEAEGQNDQASSHQNPVMSYLYYEPNSSDNELKTPVLARSPLLLDKLINSERAPINRAPPHGSKLKLKVKGSPSSSLGGRDSPQLAHLKLGSGVSLDNFMRVFNDQQTLSDNEEGKTAHLSRSNVFGVDLDQSDKKLTEGTLPLGLRQPASSLWRSTAKSIKEVSFGGRSNANNSVLQSHSIMTDNSERLRENLEAIRRQKSLKQAQKSVRDYSKGDEIKR